MSLDTKLKALQPGTKKKPVCVCNIYIIIIIIYIYFIFFWGGGDCAYSALNWDCILKPHTIMLYPKCLW